MFENITGYVILVVAAVASLVGGIIAGRAQALQGHASINQLLQSKVDFLENQNNGQAEQIARMELQLEVLKDMVTQRSEVAEVKAIVTRIAEKVGV
jgi:hypothetical protein